MNKGVEEPNYFKRMYENKPGQDEKWQPPEQHFDLAELQHPI